MEIRIISQFESAILLGNSSDFDKFEPPQLCGFFDGDGDFDGIFVWLRELITDSINFENEFALFLIKVSNHADDGGIGIIAWESTAKDSGVELFFGCRSELEIHLADLLWLHDYFLYKSERSANLYHCLYRYLMFPFYNFIILLTKFPFIKQKK